MNVVTAPTFFSRLKKVSCFLAGSIEMGKAEDWQKKLIEELSDLDIIVFNPRRDDWDSSWEQSISNDKFREQVDWELTALETADCVFIYFSPGTKSPISLLELGIFSQHKKMLIVVCPDLFWRKGNVEIVCDRYSVPLFNTLDEGIEELRNFLSASSVDEKKR